MTNCKYGSPGWPDDEPGMDMDNVTRPDPSRLHVDNASSEIDLESIDMVVPDHSSSEKSGLIDNEYTGYQGDSEQDGLWTRQQDNHYVNSNSFPFGEHWEHFDEAMQGTLSSCPDETELSLLSISANGSLETRIESEESKKSLVMCSDHAWRSQDALRDGTNKSIGLAREVSIENKPFFESNGHEEIMQNDISMPKQPKLSMDFSKLTLKSPAEEKTDFKWLPSMDSSEITLVTCEESQYIGRGLQPLNSETDQLQSQDGGICDFSDRDKNCHSDQRLYCTGSLEHVTDPSGVFDFPTITAEMTRQKNDEGDTLLHLAIIQECMTLVYFILTVVPCYTILDTWNRLHQTPLHLAVLLHQPSVVRMLVSRGARIDTRDRYGNTALHIASTLGCLQCAKELTKPVHYSEIGPRMYRVPFQRIPQDPNIMNFNGETCINLCSHSGNLELLEYLLSANIGHDVNSQNGLNGRTILHESITTRNVDLMMSLIRNRRAFRLNVNTEAFDGLTPLTLAKETRQNDIALILSLVGGKEGPIID